MKYFCQNNVLFWLIILPLLGSSCNQNTGVEPIKNSARIIPGVSIDGVCLGDYLEVVEDKLGTKKLWGFADGLRMWTIYTWPDSNYFGLQVYFISLGGDGIGPVDYLQVEAPYDGTTSEGIGIATHIREVFNEWGEPYIINDNSSYSISCIYCLDNTHMYISFKDSLLEFLSFGPFIPYPGDTTCSGI